MAFPDETRRQEVAWAPLLGIAAARFLIPLLSTWLAPIGYTSDELYYLACADHPAWGYVDHPPLAVVVLWLSRSMLGDSLLAVRLVPAICETLAVLVTALLARELGAGVRGQVIAALAFAVAPMALAIGLPYSMNPIEHLLWPLAFLLLARIQNDGDRRLWILLGLLLGVALENKLSTLWLGVGIAVGLVVSPARSCLTTRWPWLCGAIAALLLLPHLVWQVANDWPTAEFVRNNAAGREGIDAAVVMGSPIEFLLSQLVALGPLASPLWLVGLAYLLRRTAAPVERFLGLAFGAVFALVALSGRGSVYYLVGAFPIVFAAGGTAVERVTCQRWPKAFAVVCAALLLQGALLLPFLVPVVGVDAYLTTVRAVRRVIGADPQAAVLPPTYQWMLGAPELLEAVAIARDTLSDEERRAAGVLATTFGEAGALHVLGPAAGLPPAVGTHNNFWLWGPGDVDGSVLLLVVDEGSPLVDKFDDCRVEARVDCPHCEASLRRHVVFVCRDPGLRLRSLWPELKSFV